MKVPPHPRLEILNGQGCTQACNEPIATVFTSRPSVFPPCLPPSQLGPEDIHTWACLPRKLSLASLPKRGQQPKCQGHRYPTESRTPQCGPQDCHRCTSCPRSRGLDSPGVSMSRAACQHKLRPRVCLLRDRGPGGAPQEPGHGALSLSVKEILAVQHPVLDQITM